MMSQYKKKLNHNVFNVILTVINLLKCVYMSGGQVVHGSRSLYGMES